MVLNRINGEKRIFYVDAGIVKLTRSQGFRWRETWQRCQYSIKVAKRRLSL